MIRQARHLAIHGKRDEAIALLVADRTMEAIRELDVLDAVDALGEIAKKTDRPYTTSKALARRRRFDLLKPLLATKPSTLLKHRFVAPSVGGALDGLWRAPAITDDSVLIRDWLVPATIHASGGKAWLERSACAQMLALLGDVAMARMLINEMREAIAHASESERLDLLALLAPALHALGERDDAKRQLDAAQALFDEVYDEDIDNYGVPFQDTITYCRRLVQHLDVLAADHGEPWSPEAIVSATFTNAFSPGRFGENRVARDRWHNAIEHRIARGDVPGAFAIVDEARVGDPSYAPYLVVELANALPRATLDDALAGLLANRIDDRSRAAVIYALAESGHIERARELLTDDVDIGPWRDELTLLTARR